MKKIIIALSIFFLIDIFIIIFATSSSFNLYKDQEHVNYDQVFDSNTPTIYYYYQDTCHFCNSIKNQITDFAQIVNAREDINLKLIDMKKDKNKIAWYDWDSHNKKYGENNNPKLNPNYKYNPKDLKKINDIKITGTPTMIYVENKKVVQYEVGKDVFKVLENVKNKYNINYKFDSSKYGED